MKNNFLTLTLTLIVIAILLITTWIKKLEPKENIIRKIIGEEGEKECGK